MNIIVGLLVAIGLLLVIAFPERLLPGGNEKRKRVGANYWGLYNGAPPEQSNDMSTDMPTIEVVTVKKKDYIVAGSTSYVMGRGVSGNSGSSN